MTPFLHCPICGGEIIEKEVEKLLHGGSHTAILIVQAEVCLRCGERMYSQESVRRFERIRNQLLREDVAGFQPIGQTFQVV
ncbi:MAG: YgiT-type zinc finger protein [Chloroflexi bacterium]|nr:YgiT-type zinc finger protein [Chloroflexota bacterium]